MNKQQRKEITALTARLSEIMSDLELVGEELAAQQADEQEKYENLAEGLQASANGQAMEEAAASLQESVDAVEQAVDLMEQAFEAALAAAEGS